MLWASVVPEACFGFYAYHMELMREYDLFVPKHHLVWHLLGNMEYQGNPSYYATWFNEGLNKVLKGCCRMTSQATFEQSVLLRMREVLRRKTGGKRPRA